MLIMLLVLNLKMDAERVLFYEACIRIPCSIAMLVSCWFSIYFSQNPQEPTLFLLVLALQAFPQFLVTDYVQYKKHRGDIKSAELIIRKALEYLTAMMFLLAATIVCYLYF